MAYSAARGGLPPPPLPPRKEKRSIASDDAPGSSVSKLYRASVRALEVGTRAVSQFATLTSLSELMTSNGGTGACDHYVLDLTGKRYGDCKCGHSRAEHAKTAMLTPNSSSSTLNKDGSSRSTLQASSNSETFDDQPAVKLTPRSQLKKALTAAKAMKENAPSPSFGQRKTINPNGGGITGSKPPLPKGPKPPSTLSPRAQAISKRTSTFIQTVRSTVAQATNPSSSSSKYKGCNQYELDMTGATFGDCKCGKSRAEHSPEALSKAKAAAPVRAAPANLFLGMPGAARPPPNPSGEMTAFDGQDRFQGGMPPRQSQYTGPPKWVPPKPELSADASNADLAKYEKMKNLGLPQAAVEHAMVKDGVDPALYSKIAGGSGGDDRGPGGAGSTMPPPPSARSAMLSEISSTTLTRQPTAPRSAMLSEISQTGNSKRSLMPSTSSPAGAFAPPPNFGASFSSGPSPYGAPSFGNGYGAPPPPAAVPPYGAPPPPAFPAYSAPPPGPSFGAPSGTFPAYGAPPPGPSYGAPPSVGFPGYGAPPTDYSGYGAPPPTGGFPSYAPPASAKSSTLASLPEGNPLPTPNDQWSTPPPLTKEPSSTALVAGKMLGMLSNLGTSIRNSILSRPSLPPNKPPPSVAMSFRPPNVGGASTLPGPFSANANSQSTVSMSSNSFAAAFGKPPPDFMTSSSYMSMDSGSMSSGNPMFAGGGATAPPARKGTWD